MTGQFFKASGLQGHIGENKKQGMLSGNVYTKFQVFEVFGLVRGRTERHTQTDIYERKYNKPINACVTGIFMHFVSINKYRPCPTMLLILLYKSSLSVICISAYIQDCRDFLLKICFKNDFSCAKIKQLDI